MGKRLTDVDFIRELLAYFGTGTGVRLYGWVTAALVLGCETERDLLERAPGGRSQRYENVAALRGFMAHLDALGYDRAPDGVALDVFDALA